MKNLHGVTNKIMKNNIELSKMSQADWKDYIGRNRSTLFNSYPNYDFNLRFKIMMDFKEILEENGITLYLSGGALLGAKRDKDFIKWDHDVDMDVLAEELEPKCELVFKKLLDKGYIVRLIKTYPKLKINVHHGGEKVGILGMYSENSTRHRQNIQYPEWIYQETETINFRGVDFVTPNINGYLNHTYGKDWLIEKRDNFFSDALFK